MYIFVYVTCDEFISQVLKWCNIITSCFIAWYYVWYYVCDDDDWGRCGEILLNILSRDPSKEWIVEDLTVKKDFLLKKI